jgi:hypothetical protein
MSTLQEKSFQPAEFVEIAIRADMAGLSQNANFKTWMIQYIVKNLDGNNLGSAIDEVIERKVPDPWRILEVLTSSLRSLNDELQETKFARPNLPTPEGSPRSRRY